MAKFFIDRPIFAWVIALFIMVMGGVAITQLPIAQYPPVAPPSIVINAAYPGASAQTLEDSVLRKIPSCRLPLFRNSAENSEITSTSVLSRACVAPVATARSGIVE